LAGTLSPEDRLAIIDLIVSYGYYLDAGDIDAYVDNFTPDGVFAGANGSRQGREAIRERVNYLLAVGEVGPAAPMRMRHIFGIPSIHGDSERCHAETYVMIPGYDADGNVAFPLIGTYTDEIVRHEGRWRFAQRTIRMDLVGPEHPRASSFPARPAS
jgi:hypothetical protein